MAPDRRLRPADELIGPALAAMVAGLDPPEADGPLLALARRMAATIDAMPDAVAVSMLPNHAGPLVKALAELEARAVKRRGSAPAGPSRLRDLRAASRAPGRRRAELR